jgi:hypothetical protein
MEIIDRVDTERVEKLTDEQKDDLFTKLIMGKDVSEEVETSRGKFKIKYPRTADLMAIGRITASRRNYKPVEAFDIETEMLNVMTSTLDVVVISGAKWFEEARIKNKNFSFLEVPNRAFIYELYGEVSSFREKIDKRLNTQGSNDQRLPPEKGDDDTVGSGVFENLSSEQSVSKT